MSIASSNVNVFPSALRDYAGSTGKFTSENNITGILRAITDRDSYIISCSLSDLIITGKIVVHGYYFEFISNETDEPTNLYAIIKLDSSGRLIGQYTDSNIALDVDKVFYGLILSGNTPPQSDESYTYYYLQLFADGEVVEANKIKIDSEHIGAGDVTAKKKFDNLDSGLTDVNSKVTTVDTKVVSIDTRVTNLENGASGKQDKISEDNPLPINFLQNNSGSSVLKESNGGTGKASLADVTVGNAAHAANADNATVATKLTTSSCGSFDQLTYFSEGTPHPGLTIHKSTSAPSDDLGNNGDIWIRYNQE